jgi:hypothetical protein
MEKKLGAPKFTNPCAFWHISTAIYKERKIKGEKEYVL